MYAKGISYLEMRILSDHEHNALFDYYVLHGKQGDEIIGLQEEGVTYGFVIAEREPEGSSEIKCIWLLPAYRGKQLLKEVMQTLEEYEQKKGISAISVTLTESAGYFPAFERALLQTGFIRKEAAFILANCSVDETTEKTWRNISAKHLRGIKRWIERNGFSLCDYTELTEEQRAFMSDPIRSGFSQEYDISCIVNGMYGKLIPNYSRFAVYEGLPVGGTFLVEGDKQSAIFWLITVTKMHQGKGVFIPIFAQSMDMIFQKNSPYRTIVFGIKEENEEMLKIAEKIMLPMAETIKKQYKYKKMIR